MSEETKDTTASHQRIAWDARSWCLLVLPQSSGNLSAIDAFAENGQSGLQGLVAWWSSLALRVRKAFVAILTVGG